MHIMRNTKIPILANFGERYQLRRILKEKTNKTKQTHTSPKNPTKIKATPIIILSTCH